MSEYLPFGLLQRERAQFVATTRGTESRRRTGAAERVRANSLRELLTLRGLSAEGLLILAYTVLTRSFLGDQATLGIKIGPVPIYVTDATLMVLVALTFQKRCGRFLNWLFGGGGAGTTGRAVWLL